MANYIYMCVYIYVCMCVCVYTHTYIKLHSFFIHLPVAGHLGCFRILAVVNSAAMNTEVHVSFFLFFFFAKLAAC